MPLFLVSGNNLVLTGDTHRRILLARLDAQIETPFKREFEFDPLTEVCNNRQALVVAALTIVRAYIAAGRPKVATGRMPRLNCGMTWCASPLCWLRERSWSRAGIDGLALVWRTRQIPRPRCLGEPGNIEAGRIAECLDNDLWNHPHVTGASHHQS
ncbi:MAG: hypothetical protein IPG23_23315, partial [Burkholderiales bacterium]|nr:hypothetical protein [Burkholderiales bacterium]